MTCGFGSPSYAPNVRDIETIDSELRLVAAVRRILIELGEPLPDIKPMDELLDERCALTCSPAPHEIRNGPLPGHKWPALRRRGTCEEDTGIRFPSWLKRT